MLSPRWPTAGLAGHLQPDPPGSPRRMLPPDLRDRDLHFLRRLTRARMRAMGPARQLPGQMPCNPPVHRRPAHSQLRGDLHHVSAIPNRSDRIQTLLDNGQDKSVPIPASPSATSADTSHQSDRNAPLPQITWRRNVARQSPEDMWIVWIV